MTHRQICRYWQRRHVGDCPQTSGTSGFTLQRALAATLLANEDELLSRFDLQCEEGMKASTRTIRKNDWMVMIAASCFR